MQQRRYHTLRVLALVLAVVAQLVAATGALHDHLAHDDKPGQTCVACSAADQVAHLPVAAAAVTAPRPVERVSREIRRAPTPRRPVSREARGPP